MPKTNEILQIGIKIAILLVAVSVAYATLNGRVSNVEAVATKAETKADSNELAIVGIEKDITYIRKSADRREIILDKIRKKLYNGN